MHNDDSVSNIVGTWFAHTLQYGNVQEFITWIVAAVALAFAARAAREAGRTNAIQSKQLFELQEEKIQRQANSFAVWLEAGPNYDATYRISNRSGQPVFNFEVWWIDDLERGYPVVSALVPPGEWWMPLHVENFTPPQPLSLEPNIQLPITYIFTDFLQNNWRREGDGNLVQLEAVERSPYAKPNRLYSVQD